MRFIAYLFLLLGILPAALARAQSFEFSLTSSYTAGQAPSVFAVADLVGTSAADVVAHDPLADQLLVFDFQPSATNPSIMTLPGTVDCVRLETADIDQDGDIDILATHIVSIAPPTMELLVYTNLVGSFARAAYPMPVTAAKPCVGDLTGDGSKDVVVGTEFLPAIPGGFGAAVGLPSPNGIAEYEIGDFDGDGDADLIGAFVGTVGSSSGYAVQILRNSGLGAFTTLSPVMLFAGAYDGDFAVAKMNGDLRDDVVMCALRSNNRIRLRTFLGTGTAGLSAQPMIEASAFGGSPAKKISVADFNADGVQDVLFLHPKNVATFPFNPNEPLLYRPMIAAGDGTGALLPSTGRGFGTVATSVTTTNYGVGDFDADGAPDVLFGSSFLPGAGTTPYNICRSAGVAAATDLPVFDGHVSQVLTGPGGIRTSTYSLLTSGGDLLSDHFVSMTFNPGTSSATLSGPSVAITDLSGNVSFSINLGTVPGSFTETVAVPEPASVLRTTYVGPISTIIAGDGQTACFGSAFGSPLRVRLTDAATGAPIVGVQLSVEDYIGLTSVSNTSPITDAVGEVDIFVTAPSTVGPHYVDFFYESTMLLASFTLNVVSGGGTPTILAGDQQIAPVETTFALPLVAQFPPCSGMPLAGFPVFFTTMTGSAQVTTMNPTTDPGGAVSVTVDAGHVPGPSMVRAIAGPYIVDFNLLVTGLEVQVLDFTTNLIYAYDPPGRPFTILVDAPLPPPGFIPTIVGDLYVSVFSPGPFFTYADGLGLFGPPDPSLVTSSSGFFGFSVPNPPVLPGFNFVAQAITVDANYPFPQVFRLSNPAPFIF